VDVFQRILEVRTEGRGFVDLTAQTRGALAGCALQVGVCQLFLQHTSASLLIQENADPDVLGDIETWMSAAVVDGDPRFRHTDEGPDDMSAHLRAMLTCTALTIPLRDGDLALGTWQGIYLYEHRHRSHARRIVLTAWGA
jgi:secondary thiamine-phosphate synthase enzyme